ncbi:MAG: FtsX-like permease family protein [Caldilineaceae bacterium]
MSVTFIKIWADFWGNKSRTLQIALIVALGAFTIGMVMGGRDLASAAVSADWVQTNPPMIKLDVSPAMTEDQLQGLKSLSGVKKVEGLLAASIEWRKGPGQPWRVASLRARHHYDDQQIGYWTLEKGQWPTRSQVAVERSYDVTYGLALGDKLEIRIGDRTYPMQVGGILNAADAVPGPQPDLVLYTTHRRFAELTGQQSYNVIQTQDSHFDQQSAEATDALVRKRLDQLGIESRGAIPPFGGRIAPPDHHPMTNVLSVLFLLLGVVGGIVILLSLFLVYNSISAILLQQVSQIGVMKAIGANTRQVLRLYLTLIIFYGSLACLISLPMGIGGAYGIKLFFTTFVDATDKNFAIDFFAVGLQATAAFLAPILAALIPVLTGARITVREAISTYGLTGSSGLVERLVARLRNAPYLLLLLIGNVFHNKVRMTMTQLTLIGSGIIFIAVLGMYDSTQYTFGNELRSIHQYAVTLAFEQPQRQARIEPLVSTQPGVIAAEGWNVERGWIRPASQRDYTIDDESAAIFGLPFDSAMYRPQVVAGRWLQAGDGQVVVLHSKLARKAGVAVGDWVTLRYLMDRESRWQVVGLIFDPAVANEVFVPEDVFAFALTRVHQANTVWVKIQEEGGDAMSVIAKQLNDTLTAKGISISPNTIFNGQTVAAISTRRLTAYNVMVTLFSILAVVIALIGGIGLSGMLSLSVMERTREIGLMRAIGASTNTVLRLFIGEGLLQGWLSWLIAVPCALPAANLFTTQVLTKILDDQLVYHFTPLGMLLWLLLISLIAVIASWFPAHNAARISVRESLAYE